MDKRIDLPDLAVTVDQRAEATQLQQAALNDPEVIQHANARHGDYRQEQASRLAVVKGISLDEALERIPSRSIDEREKKVVELASDHPLWVKAGWRTFGELCSRAKEFDGQSMPDPIEGRQYGTSTAKFYANADKGSPTIHSWAHGESTIYVVQESFDVVETEAGCPLDQSLTTNSPNRPTAGRELSAPLKIDTFPHLSGLGDNQRPKSTYENYCHLLEGYEITARYDVIGKDLQLNIPGMQGTVDNQLSSAITRIESLAVMNGMSAAPCVKYLNLYADEQQYNPIAQWILSKEWDGTDRLPEVYDTLTARDDYPEALKRALLYRWLLSAVAAALMPSGFYCRGVLTLQGAQGLGKTSWILNLISDPMLRELYALAAHHLDPANKDSVLIAIKHWIVELGELDSSFKKDIARLKGFLTSKTDKIRKPYGSAPSDFQRRTVFAASVNEENFLVDPTGNSRWWVIPVTRINYQHRIDMQQVFAQLAVDYHAGEQWWLTREEDALLAEQNRAHEAVSAIEEQFLAALDHDLPEEQWPRLTATQVLERLGYHRPANRLARECGGVLRRHFGDPKKIRGVLKWRVPLPKDQFDTV